MDHDEIGGLFPLSAIGSGVGMHTLLHMFNGLGSCVSRLLRVVHSHQETANFFML